MPVAAGSRSSAMAIPAGPRTGPRPAPPPVAEEPAAEPTLRSLVGAGSEDVSELGAQPLVDDPKLGWETSLGQDPIPRERQVGTRLESEGAEMSLRSNVWWLVLALMIVLGVAAAVVAIATWT